MVDIQVSDLIEYPCICLVDAVAGPVPIAGDVHGAGDTNGREAIRERPGATAGTNFSDQRVSCKLSRIQSLNIGQVDALRDAQASSGASHYFFTVGAKSECYTDAFRYGCLSCAYLRTSPKALLAAQLNLARVLFASARST